LLFLCSLTLPAYCQTKEWQIPVLVCNRRMWQAVSLTEIGGFGSARKPRPSVPAHFHTGVDIKRPSNNYKNEPVFPAGTGIIISKRDDGAYAQLIIEHYLGGTACVWTVYEHIAGITVSVGDTVFADKPIARFFNTRELDSLGWQFDHLHFEVMKAKPYRLKTNQKTPQRFYGTCSLECYTMEKLNVTYYNPMEFIQNRKDTTR